MLTMLALALSLGTNTPTPPVCVTARTSAGLTVESCNGTLRSVRDDAGNVRTYAPDGTIIATDTQGRSFVLEAR